ncbi:MAG TPA: DUF4873 domain-containing protein [Actinophytocola sp.]|uniref:DUF4873 domain-containing protein n=1 Tax=Actinophytocola sp. TaxID=1872138 RepID=UPI002DDCFD4A|nr:DUF4873 domain-containing protein [Actinophytocola sp.]HEV2781130.1 DUF4873 domain-containing protein [Actinophytocola sp.]
MTEHDHDEEGYSGPATLIVDESELEVTVVLRGYFEPIDGFYHWYGRIHASDELSALLGGKNRPAVLRTAHGAAAGQLSDPDTWGRYRITGTSRPPFPVATSLSDLGNG